MFSLDSFLPCKILKNWPLCSYFRPPSYPKESRQEVGLQFFRHTESFFFCVSRYTDLLWLERWSLTLCSTWYLKGYNLFRPSYTHGIIVWSVSCIVTELFVPLFFFSPPLCLSSSSSQRINCYLLHLWIDKNLLTSELVHHLHSGLNPTFSTTETPETPLELTKYCTYISPMLQNW